MMTEEFPSQICSFQWFLRNSLKTYKESIRKLKGSFQVDDLGEPPEEVVLENYLDENGDPIQEVLQLWPRYTTVPNTDQKIYITNLPTGLEFALK